MNPAPRWTFRLPDERRVGARRPAVADGVAYVAFMYEKRGFWSSTLFALDLDTGSKRWSRTIEHVGSEAIAADGVVYWSGSDGSVRALDLHGRTLWESPHADASLGVPISGESDRLFVAEISGGAAHTWCLDRVTGRTLWRFANGGHTYRLDHADGRIFHCAVSGGEPGVPTRGTLYSLRATDGHVEWSVRSRDYLFNPIVHDGRLSVCSSRSLLLFDAARGRPLGEIELGKENTTYLLAPSSISRQPVVWQDSAGRGTDSIEVFSATPVKRLFSGERWHCVESGKSRSPAACANRQSRCPMIG